MRRVIIGLVAVAALVSNLPAVGAQVTDADVDRARDQLISAQAAADGAAARLGAARRDELDAGNRVAAVGREVAELRARADELTVLLKAKAVRAYKNNGDISSLTYVAGIVDLDEQNRRQVYVQTIIERDNRNLAEMGSVKEDLSARETELAAEQQRLESARAVAEADKSDVDAALTTIASEKSRLETQKASEDAARAAAAARALEEARRQAAASAAAAASRAREEAEAAASRKEAAPAPAREPAPAPAPADKGTNPDAGHDHPAPGGGGASYGGSACPVRGGFTITSFWGDGRNHKGLDMAAPGGTPTVAITSGTIARAGYGGGYGYMIYLAGDDGNTYLYAHHRSLAVSTGQRVSAGQVVGYVGSTGQSTGNHLHFEVRPGGGGPVDAYPTVVGVC